MAPVKFLRFAGRALVLVGAYDLGASDPQRCASDPPSALLGIALIALGAAVLAYLAWLKR